MIIGLLAMLFVANSYSLFNCTNTSCLDGWIGDNYCDMACMNPACNYDSPITNKSKIEIFQSSDCFYYCDCDLSWLGDGYCDYSCNNYACGWDLGDCGYCSSGCTEEMLKNSKCDAECSNILCMYDDNQCGWCNEGCFVENLTSGSCGLECISYKCSYFSSNCNEYTCNKNCFSYMLANSYCDEECNVKDCNYDNFYCICAEGCYNENLGDGICHEKCNNYQCKYDYGDCGCAPGCPYTYDESLELFIQTGEGSFSDDCLVLSCHFASSFYFDEDYLVIEAVLNYLITKSNSFDSTLCSCEEKKDYIYKALSCEKYDKEFDCSNEKCSYCMGSITDMEPGCLRASFDECLICDSSMILDSCERALKNCPIGYINADFLAIYFEMTNKWCLPEPITYSINRYKIFTVDSSLDSINTENDNIIFNSLYSALVNVYASYTKIYIISNENDLVVDSTESILIPNKFDPLNTKVNLIFNELWIIGNSADKNKVTVTYKSLIILSPLAKKVYIQNIFFDGTKSIKVECNQEICAYCPYYLIEKNQKKDDKNEVISIDTFGNYSINCTSYSNVNYFNFSTYVEISNVDFYNFRSQYNSFIRSSKTLNLSNVNFIRMQAKATGSIILMTCITDCIDANFIYYNGSVSKLGSGYQDNEGVATGSFFKAIKINNITINSVHFTFNFLMNNLRSPSPSYLIYSLNHIGSVNILSCNFYNIYVNYLIYIDITSIDYSEINNAHDLENLLNSQLLTLSDIQMKYIYCSSGLFFYSMQMVIQNMLINNIEISDSVVGKYGFFYINNLGLLGDINIYGGELNTIVNRVKVTISLEYNSLIFYQIQILDSSTGGYAIYLNTYPFVEIKYSIFSNIIFENPDDIKEIINNFENEQEHLNFIDIEKEFVQFSCINILSFIKVHNINIYEVTVQNLNCSGLLTSSCHELYLEKITISNISASALEIKNLNEIYINDAVVDSCTSYEYSIISIESCVNVTFNNFIAQNLESYYSSPLAISDVNSFKIFNISLESLKNYYGNGGCLNFFTSPIMSSITMNSVLFSDCFSKNGDGGGIFLNALSTESRVNLNLYNLTFESCHANEGAAIYISSTTSIIYGEAEDLVIKECLSGMGGIITDYHFKGLLHFNRLDLISNTGNNAGYLAYYSTNYASLKIENAIFFNSNSSDKILSFKSLLNSTQVSLKNINISNSINDVSAIFASKIELLAELLIIDNIPAGIEITSGTNMTIKNFLLKKSKSIGVYLSYSSTFICEDCIFQENTYTVLYIDEKSSIKVSNSVFEENNVRFDTLFWFTASENSLSLISNSEIKNNKMQDDTLIYLSQAQLELNNLTISSNIIKFLDYSGIYSYKASLMINNCNFNNMTTKQKGSFIYAAGSSTLTLKNSIFQTGTSKEGNIYVKDSKIDIINCVFQENQGGDLNIETSEINMINSIVNSSLVVKNNGWNLLYFNENKNIKIKNCSFLNPSQNSMYSMIHLKSCTFLNLEDSFFNGFQNSLKGLFIQDTSFIVIRNSSFKYFSPQNYSALTAISGNQDDSLEITDSLFENNESPNNGGALNIDNYNLTLTSTKIKNNSAHNSGGGIFYQSKNCKNCGIFLSGRTLITNNECGEDGGGIKWTDKMPEVTTEVDIKNNKAVYGNNFASFPNNFEITHNRYLSEVGIFQDLSPGQEYNGEISISIKDIYNQTILTDYSSTIELSVSEANYSVSGETNFVSVAGIITIKKFIVSGPPGSSFNIILKSSFQVTSETYSASLRPCKEGEKKSETTCLKCPSGKYLIKPEDSCKSCPAGATCPGGSSIRVKKGYWRSKLDSEIVYPCQYSQACNEGDEEHPSGNCAVGYEGVLCQSCELGYTMNSYYKCLKCPNKAGNVAILLALLLGIIILTIILINETLKSAFKSTSMHSIYIKIFTNYLQLLLITTQFNLEWPTYVLQFFKLQQGTATLTDQMFSLDCFLDDNSKQDKTQGYYIKLIVMAGLPFLIFLASVLYWVIYSYEIKSYNYLKREVFLTIIVVFFLNYPSITKALLSNFDCLDIDKMKSYLRVNTRVKCWSTQHRDYSLFIAVPGIALWVFGFPFALVILMTKYRNKLHHDHYRVIFGYLFNGYRLKYFFWEFVIIFRKVLLILVSIFFSSQDVMVQALIVLFVMIFSLFVQYLSKPFNSKRLNNMETEALFTATVTIYSGLYFISGSISEGFKIFLFLVILFGNSYFLVHWFYYMIQALIDYIIRHFPRFRTKLRGGDGFEQDFNQEKVVQNGIYRNRIEGKKAYTFMELENFEMRKTLRFFNMDEAFRGALRNDLRKIKKKRKYFDRI